MNNLALQAQLPTPLVTLRFCVRQLTARDELLLKSLIRLLSHRTLQRWMYCTDGLVDVVILGDCLDESFAEAEQKPLATANVAQQKNAPLTLAIGHARQEQPYFLYLPLHANALEQMLNQIGQAVPPAMAPVASPKLVSHFSARDSFRLLRWPPSTVLPTAQYRKLATLLSGKPQLLETVIERSGLQRRECEIFLHRLQNLNLLETISSPFVAAVLSISKPVEAQPLGESPVHWRASLSLVARIRSRLGLTSSASR